MSMLNKRVSIRRQGRQMDKSKSKSCKMMVVLTRIIAGEVKRNRIFIFNLEQITLVWIECVVRERKKKWSKEDGVDFREIKGPG